MHAAPGNDGARPRAIHRSGFRQKFDIPQAAVVYACLQTLCKFSPERTRPSVVFFLLTQTHCWSSKSCRTRRATSKRFYERAQSARHARQARLQEDRVMRVP